MKSMECTHFFLKNRMQESLDDAIWILKSHAESTFPRSQGMPPSQYSSTPQFPTSLTNQLQSLQNAALETPGGLEASTNALLDTMNSVRAEADLLGNFHFLVVLHFSVLRQRVCFLSLSLFH